MPRPKFNVLAYLNQHAVCSDLAHLTGRNHLHIYQKRKKLRNKEYLNQEWKTIILEGINKIENNKYTMEDCEWYL